MATATPQQPTPVQNKADPPGGLAPHFAAIPTLLRAGRTYVVWKREPRRGGLISKTPYIARALLESSKAYRASSANARSWSTFPQAQKAYERGGYDGIGYVLAGNVIFGDIDHCLNPITGQIDPVALEILSSLETYIERSPSGDGIHFFSTGQLPPDAANVYHYRGLKIELYDSGRYATLTGVPVNGLPFIQEVRDQQATIASLIERFTSWRQENTSVLCVCGRDGCDGRCQTCDANPRPCQTTLAPMSDSSRSQPSINEASLSPVDQAVLAKARAAKNGHVFQALWTGGNPLNRKRPDGSDDTSAADFDLVLMLLYWCGDSATHDTSVQVERLYRASGRYDTKTDRKATGNGHSYLQLTIYNARHKRYKAIWKQQPPPPRPTPKPAPGPAREIRRITHLNQWARSPESAAEREARLQETAQQVAAQVEQHILSGEHGLLVANVAPGVGKSSTVAALGERTTARDLLDLAWIAERRDMTSQVEALRYYRHIAPCTRHNCPDHTLHNALGERGYNTWTVHQRHSLQCEYAQQFQQEGSAVYQLAHVKTRYPSTHQGIVIDELDIPKWLPERELSTDRLTGAARIYPTDSVADRLLRLVVAVIIDAAQANTPLSGLALFTALDSRSGGQLANWIGELAQDARHTNTHPWHDLEEDDPIAAELEATQLAPVVLPHLVVALMSELVKWQRGTLWNSCLRISPGAHGWSFFITERLTFTPGEQGIPPRVILDGTADSDLLHRLFRIDRGELNVITSAVEPPSGMRHIAVRTGKRYGKVALCTRRKDGQPNRDLARAIAEARYLLRDLDPDDEAIAAGRVGVISYKDCVDAIGEALGIAEPRRLHFWGARGSNALEDCTILLVIGTPTVHPDTVTRLARALWSDDPQPIDPTPRKENGKITGYVDPRMQRLNTYLTRSELTQCAHRSRALRYQDRMVVTFCTSDIDYLPATETITELPQLLPDGRVRWAANRAAEHAKLDQARETLEQQGKTVDMISVRELRALAGVATDAAADYLRQERQQHTTHQCCQTETSVPDPARDHTSSTTRYNEQMTPLGVVQPGTVTAPPVAIRPCCRCGCLNDWTRDPDNQHWICRCYYWWYEHPEWRDAIKRQAG